MSRFKIGASVTYAENSPALRNVRPGRTPLGQVDRVIGSAPALVYVRWDDGNYHAVSEQQLELA